MLLVGHVSQRTAILIDDLADTSNTITRAAKLLKKEGAHTVYALVTHGVFSGDAVERINASAVDKVVCTNSVPQEEHLRQCPKLEVLEVGNVFAEVSDIASVLLGCDEGPILTGTHRQSVECTTERASACFSNTIESIDRGKGNDREVANRR